MKISQEELIKIIKEEVQNALGGSSLTKSAASKDLTQQKKDVASGQEGITNLERGVIADFVKTLTTAAETENIKTGQIFSLLNKVNDVLKKRIAKSQQNNDPVT